MTRFFGGLTRLYKPSRHGNREPGGVYIPPLGSRDTKEQQTVRGRLQRRHATKRKNGKRSYQDTYGQQKAASGDKRAYGQNIPDAWKD